MAVDSRGRKLPPLEKKLTEYQKKQIKIRDDASVKKAEKKLIEKRNPRKPGENVMDYRTRLRRIQKDGETKKPEVKKTDVNKKTDDKKIEVKKTNDKKTEVKKTTPSFGKAFADARRDGKKTFMWKGKSYNTKRADDKPAVAPTKKLDDIAPTDIKTTAELGPLTDKETKRARNNALTEKAKKDLLDRAKNTTGINRPATAKEQMGRDQQKNARKSMGMKKGGRVKGKCKVDGIAIRGRTKAKHK